MTWIGPIDWQPKGTKLKTYLINFGEQNNEALQIPKDESIAKLIAL